MATNRKTGKLNLRFVLEQVHVPSLLNTGLRRHLLALELVWPRTGIPRRTTIVNLPLVNGLCPTDAWSLANKLCFKETCEHAFGLKAGITEPISSTNLRHFLAFIAGKSADIAADALEDNIPLPIADELAALPLTYLSRQLLADQDPQLIALGATDLATADFSTEPQKITVPLLAQKCHGAVQRHDLDGEVTFSVQAY